MSDKERPAGSADGGARGRPGWADPLEIQRERTQGALDDARRTREWIRLRRQEFEATEEMARLRALPSEPVSRHGHLTAAEILAGYRQTSPKGLRPTRFEVAETLSSPRRVISEATLKRAQGDLGIPGWPPPGI